MGVEFDKDSSWPPWVGVNSLSSQIELGIHISARTYVTISGNGQTASLKEAMMSISTIHTEPRAERLLKTMSFAGDR